MHETSGSGVGDYVYAGGPVLSGDPNPVFEDPDQQPWILISGTSCRLEPGTPDLTTGLFIDQPGLYSVSAVCWPSSVTTGRYTLETSVGRGMTASQSMLASSGDNLTVTAACTFAVAADEVPKKVPVVLHRDGINAEAEFWIEVNLIRLA